MTSCINDYPFEILNTKFCLNTSYIDWQKEINLLAQLIKIYQEEVDRLSVEKINDSNYHLQNIVEKFWIIINEDQKILLKIAQDSALKALHTQIVIHLKHIRLHFYMEDYRYVHAFVIKRPYPFQPTLIVLQKLKNFLDILSVQERQSLQFTSKNVAKEQALKNEQKEFLNSIKKEPFKVYQDLKNRLITGGQNISFPEFKPVIEYLEMKLNSDDIVKQICSENLYLSRFRSIVLERITSIQQPSHQYQAFPYMQTIEAIQSTVEFFDILHRTNTPNSSTLYHSNRYEYYNHFLKGSIPEHILMPTICSLGATDMIAMRGVPIGLIGVTTEKLYVDGYEQTPYEFYVHDINHSRRMYQFSKEGAEKKKMTLDEFLIESTQLIQNQLLPLYSFNLKVAISAVPKPQASTIKNRSI